MQQTPVAIVEPPVPKEPPPEFEFLADPPTISALDLYVLLCVCFSFVENILVQYTIKKKGWSKLQLDNNEELHEHVLLAL